MPSKSDATEMTLSPGHSRGRFVQARARHASSHVPLLSIQTALHPCRMHATARYRGTPGTVCSIASSKDCKPDTGSRSQPARQHRFLDGAALALLLHVALPAPSATHMHAATAGPSTCAAARSCAAAVAAAARPCTCHRRAGGGRRGRDGCVENWRIIIIISTQGTGARVS